MHEKVNENENKLKQESEGRTNILVLSWTAWARVRVAQARSITPLAYFLSIL